MPPIEINGQTVSDVVVNGQSVDEITANGQTVFTATPDHRWPATEGSGLTIADSIGSADATHPHDQWTGSDDYIGETAPNLDGTNEAIICPHRDAYEGVADLTFTINLDGPEPSATAQIAGVYDFESDDRVWRMQYNPSESNSWWLWISDNGSDTDIIQFNQPWPSETFQVGFRWTSESNPELAINGDFVAADSGSTGISELHSATVDMLIGSREDDDDVYNGVADNWMIEAVYWSDARLSDWYNDQPFNE